MAAAGTEPRAAADGRNGPRSSSALLRSLDSDLDNLRDALNSSRRAATATHHDTELVARHEYLRATRGASTRCEPPGGGNRNVPL